MKGWLLPHERGLFRANMSCFVIIWDNMAFHHSRVNDWFTAHPRMMMLFLPAYSPMLNPIEEFLPCWRWKVYDHRPYDQMSLLDAMNAACLANRLRELPGMDSPFQTILSSMHCNGRHQLWWWEHVAWSSGLPRQSLNIEYLKAFHLLLWTWDLTFLISYYVEKLLQ